MSLASRIFDVLPGAWRSSLITRKIEDGSAFELPVFAMLLRSLENFGGRREEIEAALRSPEARGIHPRETFRALGARLTEEGAALEASGGKQSAGAAREAYLRSAVYYLASDWFGIDADEISWNYERMLLAFDAYRRLCDPPIEKVTLPFGEGTIFAHFRAPRGASKAPAVLIVQGNDEVKEFNTRMEEAALAQGLAVLDLDPPGWGESYLAGTRCRGPEDYRKAIALAVDYLSARAEVEALSIGVMGVSFGGLLAPYAASLEPRIAAAAGLGGPSCSTSKWRSTRRRMPALQRERSYLYSGAKDEASALAWYESMGFREALSGLRSPLLLVHGEKDELVSPASAYENAGLVAGPSEVRIVQGGDHMCNATLIEETLPAIFSWMASRSPRPTPASLG
jgi:pimeloyl-ACP methyl ester carboxylesterase